MDTNKLNSLIDRNAKRKRPMKDKEVIQFLSMINYSDQWRNNLVNDFKKIFDQWIHNHELISFTGLDAFPDRKVIFGVTQSINDIYITNPNCVVIFEGDFFYHETIYPNIKKRTVDTLIKGDVLLMSAPFCCHTYNIHPEMSQILEKCLQENIPVHLDAAWYPCSKGINFNVDHPAIQTVSFSLSKAYGISEQRCGVRYARQPINGPVDFMNNNDFFAITNIISGIELMNKFGTDFFWKKYGKLYDTIIKVCPNLKPSPAIHVAFATDDNGKIIRAVPTRDALFYLAKIYFS